MTLRRRGPEGNVTVVLKHETSTPSAACKQARQRRVGGGEGRWADRNVSQSVSREETCEEEQ